MSSAKLSDAQLTRQGIDWLKAHREEFLFLTIKGINELRWRRRLQMADEQIATVANRNVSDIIERLEGKKLNSQELRDIFLSVLKNRGELESTILGLSQLNLTWSVKIRRDLAQQPEVAEVLIVKISYVISLLKSEVAAAIIEYEGQKATNSKSHFTALMKTAW